MRNNPNKVIKIISAMGIEYAMFLTGKMLSFYLLAFNVSYREEHDKNTFELHACGQTKAVRFFCDKTELNRLMEPRGKKENG